MELVIGLDLGTTTCKAVALAPGLQVIATADAFSSRNDLQTEQEAGSVWAAAVLALRRLGEKAPLQRAAGLSLSGAMQSLLLVAADGEPLAPALTWADGRSIPQAARLRALPEGAGLYARTGCPLRANYYPARLRWWLEEAPSAFRQAQLFTGLKDWILHRLTGEWATDLSLASSTGLLDIHRYSWDAAALSLAGIQAERLPRLISPLEIAGRLQPEAARETGLPAGLPVVAGASDGALANLGAGAARPGQRVVTVGTSGAVRRIAGQPRLDPRERTWCYILKKGSWFCGGAVNNGGLAVQWALEKFYPDLLPEAGYARLFADAVKVPPGAGGLFFLPYLSGERSPHWRTDPHAALIGLGLEHGREHIARAVLEGVLFCLADVTQVLDEAWPASPSGAPASGALTLLTGRITRVRAWSQMAAQVLGAPLELAERADASPLGAGMLGLAALGLAGSPEELAAQVPPGSLLEPDPEYVDCYRQLHARFQELYRKLQDGSAAAGQPY